MVWIPIEGFNHKNQGECLFIVFVFCFVPRQCRGIFYSFPTQTKHSIHTRKISNCNTIAKGQLCLKKTRYTLVFVHSVCFLFCPCQRNLTGFFYAFCKVAAFFIQSHINSLNLLPVVTSLVQLRFLKNEVVLFISNFQIILSNELKKRRKGKYTLKERNDLNYIPNRKVYSTKCQKNFQVMLHLLGLIIPSNLKIQD